MSKSSITKVIVVHESVLSSIIKDIISFIWIIGGLYLNNRYLGGSGWINFLLVFFLFGSLIARARKSNRDQTFFTPEALKNWVNDNIK